MKVRQTLFDYLPNDGLLIIDESHVTVPQIGAMYKGDRSRKETLVEFGFRLPSARANHRDDNDQRNNNDCANNAAQIVHTTPAMLSFRLRFNRSRALHQAITAL